ncbi:hypothetical protein, partial [Hymenobacter convexus]|uniref:hypothetical protein n=1 Tax=Hymenobacter sp. CA1UV-4 TaxID=3063782 RepID=UPI0027122B95
FRTEPLSPGAPMVLPSPVGESVAANFINRKSLQDAFASSPKGFLLCRWLYNHRIFCFVDIYQTKENAAH